MRRDTDEEPPAEGNEDVTEATESSNKIWPAECVKNPLAADAILWVTLPLCFLPHFITRRDEGGPDS